MKKLKDHTGSALLSSLLILLFVASVFAISYMQLQSYDRIEYIRNTAMQALDSITVVKGKEISDAIKCGTNYAIDTIDVGQLDEAYRQAFQKISDVSVKLDHVSCVYKVQNDVLHTSARLHVKVPLRYSGIIASKACYDFTVNDTYNIK